MKPSQGTTPSVSAQPSVSAKPDETGKPSHGGEPNAGGQPGGKGEPPGGPAVSVPGAPGAAGRPSAGAPLPNLPGPAPSAPVVLPPVKPSAQPGAADDDRTALMSPAGLEKGEGTNWAVVLGVVFVAEIGLLWGATCIVLTRRRSALSRPEGGADQGTTA